MSQPDPAIEFIIGARVVGDDGTLGQLRRVIVDPIARAVTHLVVEAAHRHGSGHLVPVTLVSSAHEDEIRLNCTRSHFATLEEAEEIQFNSGVDEGEYAQTEMFSTPYYPLAVGMGGMGMGMGGMGMEAQTFVHDRIPAGEVEVRRGDPVQATDGAIGHVQGLVVDPSDHGVTHVLLRPGHLWGKRRVAIPIHAVTRVDDGIQVALSKRAVEDLPAVELGEPDA